MNEFKVGTKTSTSKLAGAIASAIRNGDELVLSTVGTNSLNIAIKAIIMARQFLLQDEVKSDFVVQSDIVSEQVDAKLGEEGKYIRALKHHLYRVEFDENRAVSPLIKKEQA